MPQKDIEDMTDEELTAKAEEAKDCFCGECSYSFFAQKLITEILRLRRAEEDRRFDEATRPERG